MSFDQNAYEEEIFSKLQLLGKATEGVTFEECTFDACRLQESMFTKCRFIDCTFKGCMLSAVKVTGCAFQECAFTDCKIIGVDWSRVTELRGAVFTRCEMGQCNFAFLKLSKLVMTKGSLRESYLTECVCIGADFRETDFSGTIFAKDDVSSANFTGATNYAIDVRDNKIAKATFSLPEAVSLLRGLEIELS